MKRLFFMFAFVMIMALSLFTLISNVKDVEAYFWETEATMTLTESGEEVMPDIVYDGSDGNRKLKIYTIKGDKNYILQTSSNNDYAVLFKTYTVKYVDPETEYARYPELTITFDNINIKTKNPVQTDIDTNNSFAAVYFHGITIDNVEPKINLFLKGNNTIELNDVKNDLTKNCWAAIAFDNCDGPYVKSIKDTQSQLNLKVDLPSSLGKVSGFSQKSLLSDVEFGYDYSEKDDFANDFINLNVYVNAINSNTLEKYGDGLYSETSGFVLEYLTQNEIIAPNTGINSYGSFPKSGIVIRETTTIRAKEIGINAYNNLVVVNADTTITGLDNGNGEYDRCTTGIYASSSISISNANVNIKSVEEAIRLDKFRDIPYDPYGGQSGATFGVSNNSVLTIDAAQVDKTIENEIEREVYAINCTGAGSYFNLEDSKVIINAGYRALWVSWGTFDGEIIVNTTKHFDGSAMAIGRYATFSQYTYSETEIIKCKADFNVACDYIALGGTLYLYSDDLMFKSAKTAFGESVYLYRNESIPTTYQSLDGNSWSPFKNNNIMPYVTTRPQATHVCANDTYNAFKENENENTHSAKCLICDNIITEDCHLEHSFTNNPEINQEGAHFYYCDICGRYLTIVIEPHDCSEYCTSWTDLGNNHQGRCTKEGCGVTFERDHTFGEWVRINNLTKERECEYCGHKETEDIHKKVTHILEVAPSCTSVGTNEGWYCDDDDCKCFYLNSDLTVETTLEYLIKPKTSHTYQDGKCLNCGDTSSSMTFIYERIQYFSESMNAIKYIAIAKHNDKYYAMGNATNSDGSRVAIEVFLNEYGAFEVLPTNVEIFSFEYNPISTFTADGGYMAIVDDKIVIYEKQYANILLKQPISYNEQDNYELDTIEGNLFSPSKNDYWDRQYIYFDIATKSFKPTTEANNNVLMYREACMHDDGLFHQIHVNPTCFEQGTKEYWRCECCDKFYVNNNLVVPFKLPEGYYDYEEYFTIFALGHEFNEDDICVNCTMKRPVYSLVTSTEALRQMPQGTTYLIVVKDGEKTYAMYFPEENPFVIDKDGNGIFDVLETNLDENNVPNGIKGYDINENGIEDYLEDSNEDGIVDMNDWKDYVKFGLINYYFQLIYSRPNFVEVTIREDGTIYPIAEKPMEFYLQPSGPWGRWGDEFHGGGGDILHRQRSASEYTLISQSAPNWWAMYIPNRWLYHSGDLGYWEPEFLSEDYRIYGDYLFPGVIDHHNWYIDIKEDATACMVTGYYNNLYEEATLRMITYTENGEQIKTIGGFNPNVNLNFTIETSLPVYLYASIPEYTHTHTYGEWQDDHNGNHYHECNSEGCNYSERFAHTYTSWQQVNEEIHQRTCSGCNLTQQENHLFGNMVMIDAKTHSIQCLTCGYEKVEDHEFDNWLPLSEKEHERECGCGQTEKDNHHYGNEVIFKAATHSETGISRKTCNECGHTVDTEIPKLTDHSFGNWIFNDRNPSEHLRRCECGEVEYDTHHFGESVVIKASTHLEVGTSRKTCNECGYYIDTEIPKLTDHAFDDWMIDEESTSKHVRECSCGAKETQDCQWNNGEVTTEPTLNATGIKTFTCTICGREKYEVLGVLVSTNQISNDNYNATIVISTGSNASFTTNVIFEISGVTNMVSEEAKGKIEILSGKGATVLASYDISLLKDGVVYQPGGRVEVTIAMPEDISNFANFTVVYIDDNNNVTPCETRINNDGTITFITDHFSQYAIIGIPSQEKPKKGGFCSKGSIIIPLLTSLSLLCFVIRRKK